jgi:hypothetical protein
MTLGFSLPRLSIKSAQKVLFAPVPGFEPLPIQPESLQKGVEWSVAIRDTMPRKSFANHVVNTAFNPSRPKIS